MGLFNEKKTRCRKSCDTVSLTLWVDLVRRYLLEVPEFAAAQKQRRSSASAWLSKPQRTNNYLANITVQYVKFQAKISTVNQYTVYTVLEKVGLKGNLIA
jgi:hypothetical protein